MLASLSFPPFEAGHWSKDKGCSARQIGRGMVGTFCEVSWKKLSLYVAELQFRYNNRENANIFGEAVRAC